MKTLINKAFLIILFITLFNVYGYSQDTNFDFLILDRNNNADGYVAFDAGRYRNSSGNWVYSELYGNIGVFSGTLANRILNLDAGRVIMTRGNFGIGTTNPGFKLHVMDRAKFDGSTAGLWVEAGSSDWFLGRTGVNGQDFRFYNGGDRITIKKNGNLGIGTTNPSQKLDVIGNIKASGSITTSSFNLTGSGTAMSINVPTGSYNALRADNNGQGVGRVHFFDDTWQNGNINRSGGTINISGFKGVTLGEWSNPLLIADETQRSVEIDGVVRCREELTIHDATEAFPDYVFEETYDLRNLSEVETYIKANKHLPEVPSAKEVGENGLGIYKMNTLLLKKVEELTLYTIAQEKQLKNQNEKFEAQENRISQLEILLKELVK